MADFSNLPTEIWLLIVADFSYDEFLNFRSLNSFFFNCWMDTQWKSVTIGTNNSVRLLKRVVCVQRKISFGLVLTME
jgi:hypothetical protein